MNASTYNVTGASALAAEPEKIIIVLAGLFVFFIVVFGIVMIYNWVK